MASYRYRAMIPAKSIGAGINDARADVLIFAKPLPGDYEIAVEAKQQGKTVIVDFCDDHFSTPLYRAMAQIADRITCSTLELALRAPKSVYIVRDTYEFPEVEPHCQGDNLLWFGHRGNLKSIRDKNIPGVRIVSNVPGAIPWSIQTMREEFARADIVLMPATAPYKSPNRTLEAIRQGCCVIAEPHPALTGFPIYIGDLKEGIEWATKHPEEANAGTKKAQAFIKSRYSPETQASAWKTILAGLDSTSVAGKSAGLVGST